MLVLMFALGTNTNSFPLPRRPCASCPALLMLLLLSAGGGAAEFLVERFAPLRLLADGGVLKGVGGGFDMMGATTLVRFQ